MARRVLFGLALVACAAAVIGFQVTRPVKASSDPKVFVPSPRFYEHFSPSYRTSVADVYWLGVVQYYGEHIEGTGVWTRCRPCSTWSLP